MYLLGYDIGSSSVKASLVNAENGKCVASAFYPKTEAPIISKKPGWAEQDPAMWMGYLRQATADVLAQAQAVNPKDIRAIGLSYQMHGLVCVDKDLNVLRPAIIWCDSRAVPYGQQAFEALGEAYCLPHLLNSPGNFTAAKLAWVKENEAEVYKRIWKVMLPGDFIAMRLTDVACTTVSGLSEGVFWDFQSHRPSVELLDFYGFDPTLLPQLKPLLSQRPLLLSIRLPSSSSPMVWKLLPHRWTEKTMDVSSILPVRLRTETRRPSPFLSSTRTILLT